jgi:hypothetical protein
MKLHNVERNNKLTDLCIRNAGFSPAGLPAVPGQYVIVGFQEIFIPLLFAEAVFQETFQVKPLVFLQAVSRSRIVLRDIPLRSAGDR